MSNELGAGRPQAARLAARVVVLLALIVGTSEALVIVLVRDLWGYAYSSEEEVARYTARMMPVLAVSVMLDGQQCVLSGVVRGCGRQKAGAFINLAAYYLAGIPAALAFAFVRRLAGMVLSCSLCNFDWDPSVSELHQGSSCANSEHNRASGSGSCAAWWCRCSRCSPLPYAPTGTRK